MKASMTTWTTSPREYSVQNERLTSWCFCARRQANPIAPEETISETPVHAPLPPRTMRYVEVMRTATTVGIVPKNSPERASTTDRVSKIMPVAKVQGISMTKMPIVPIAIPAIACRTQALDTQWKAFSRS